MADGDPELLCVDIGAGKGTITMAALRRGGKVLAIEKDPRLSRDLHERFANEPRVEIHEGDAMSTPLPNEPFVIAANPPFNISTQLVRRWLTVPNFVSGALIVERPFGRRLAGEFGATKLSIAYQPYLRIEVAATLNPSEFSPRPRIDVAIITVRRNIKPTIPDTLRGSYWAFINYLFERGQHTIGESLAPLSRSIERGIGAERVQNLTGERAIYLYETLVKGNTLVETKIKSFNQGLPSKRRLDAAAEQPVTAKQAGRSNPTEQAGPRAEAVKRRLQS